MDANNILIKTPDKLEKIDLGEPKESCGNIRIKYEFQLRNERQSTNDEQILDKIQEVLATTGPCIDRYYKSANPANNITQDINRMIANNEHRSAVESILGYTYGANCPISPEAYNLMKELSIAMDLKPHYLERVASLVTR